MILKKHDVTSVYVSRAMLPIPLLLSIHITIKTNAIVSLGEKFVLATTSTIVFTVMFWFYLKFIGNLNLSMRHIVIINFVILILIAEQTIRSI